MPHDIPQGMTEDRILSWTTNLNYPGKVTLDPHKPPDAPPERQKSVHIALELQSTAISNLLSLLGELRTRLEPVMRPCKPEEAESGDKEHENQECQLSRLIEINSEQIRMVVHALEDMLARLEI